MKQLGFLAGMATLMLAVPAVYAQDTQLTVTPQKASGIYRSGENRDGFSGSCFSNQVYEFAFVY